MSDKEYKPFKKEDSKCLTCKNCVITNNASADAKGEINETYVMYNCALNVPLGLAVYQGQKEDAKNHSVPSVIECNKYEEEKQMV